MTATVTAAAMLPLLWEMEMNRNNASQRTQRVCVCVTAECCFYSVSKFVHFH